jgi:hypothetical protein
MIRPARWICPPLLVGLLASCGASAPAARGEPWPEADELFRHDPLWVGSDGAYSTDLGNGRVLWLFGDTGVARDARRNTNDAFFIRNSIAIQTGYDPSHAFISFYWSQDANGQPSSFFPGDKDSWIWPGAAARVGKGLIVFGQRLVNPGSGPIQFSATGTVAFFIADADADPASWQPADAHPPDLGSQVILCTAAAVHGDYLYAFGNRDGDQHDYVVSRFALSDASQGDLSRGEFYQHGRWVSASTMSGLPDVLFNLGAPESSVSWSSKLGLFVMAQSEGFGSTSLAIRTAPAPEGPWTGPRTIYRPEESFLDGQFVYAGKGHPELRGADLVLTYFPSTQGGSPPLPFPDDFYPRFVKVTF